MTNRKAVFDSYGVTLHNLQWSWGGYDKDGRPHIQVWVHHQGYGGNPHEYIAHHPQWKDRNGNTLSGTRERLRHLEDACDPELGGFALVAEGYKPADGPIKTLEFMHEGKRCPILAVVSYPNGIKTVVLGAPE